tara:strand:+ start:262 stop:591 length:330 start_codon:yes stop_codon:yes gene_type:complete
VAFCARVRVDHLNANAPPIDLVGVRQLVRKIVELVDRAITVNHKMHTKPTFAQHSVSAAHAACDALMNDCQVDHLPRLALSAFEWVMMYNSKGHTHLLAADPDVLVRAA